MDGTWMEWKCALRHLSHNVVWTHVQCAWEKSHVWSVPVYTTRNCDSRLCCCADAIHSRISHDHDLPTSMWKTLDHSVIEFALQCRSLFVSGFCVFFTQRCALSPSVFLVKCSSIYSSNVHGMVESCRRSKKVNLTSPRHWFETFRFWSIRLPEAGGSLGTSTKDLRSSRFVSFSLGVLQALSCPGLLLFPDSVPQCFSHQFVTAPWIQSWFAEWTVLYKRSMLENTPLKWTVSRPLFFFNFPRSNGLIALNTGCPEFSKSSTILEAQRSHLPS